MDPQQIDDAGAHLGVVIPTPVRLLYQAGDGRYNDDGQWWVVWPLNRVVAENRRAWEAGELPGSLLAFGDDGTGNPFCVDLDRADVGVVRWNGIEGSIEREEGSIAEFLAEWVADDS